jgi:hypothetical protein
MSQHSYRDYIKHKQMQYDFTVLRTSLAFLSDKNKTQRLTAYAIIKENISVIQKYSSEAIFYETRFFPK